ncbi:MAG: secondary thiamine-phosphate synthase enzyme YjbQ [Bacteroidota bacterium]
MEIKTLTLTISTKGHNQIIDITQNVQDAVSKSGMKEGSALIFVPGSTAGITSIEYEPGLIKDIDAFYEQLIPSDKNYYHNETWNDKNGYAHIRAALQGASFTVPFKGAKLLLGTWQQIVVIDFDNRSRNRNIIVQLTGK